MWNLYACAICYLCLCDCECVYMIYIHVHMYIKRLCEEGEKWDDAWRPRPRGEAIFCARPFKFTACFAYRFTITTSTIHSATSCLFSCNTHLYPTVWSTWIVLNTVTPPPLNYLLANPTGAFNYITKYHFTFLFSSYTQTLWSLSHSLQCFSVVFNNNIMFLLFHLNW